MIHRPQKPPQTAGAPPHWEQSVAESTISSSSPTPQAAGPCSWACRRVCVLSLNKKRNDASPPPARGAGLRNQRAEGTGCRHRRPGGLRLFTEDKARRSSIEKAEWGFVVSFLLSFSAGLCWLSHRPLPRPLPAALNACLKCSGAWIFSAVGFPAGGFPGGRRCLPLRGKVRRPQATIKMLDFLSFHIVSIVLFIPPILRLATASHVRRPQMCSRPKYPIKNTGGSAIRVMGISGFRVPMFSGFGLTGGGLWVAGLKWVGSVVLFPPRAILPQGEESDGSLRRCLALPGRGRCRCARSTLFALRAKALQSGAPYFGVSRKKQGFGAFCPSGNSPRRAGERGNGLLPARVGVFPARRQLHVLPMSLSPQETEIRPISQTKRAPYSCKTFHFIHLQQTRPFTNRVSSPPRFAANIERAPKPSFPRLQKAISPPFPPPHPPSSRLPKRRRRTAPARGPSAVYALCRRNRNETKRPCPLLVGHGRVNTEPTALAGDTVALPASTCRRPCRLRRGWQPVPARGCP